MYWMDEPSYSDTWDDDCMVAFGSSVVTMDEDVV